ncbi:MAG TPA: hypothetical protein VK593_06240, partial [Edaphobacter sp.]|nr:hypothetical protein [Edaphobacter sp.]
MVKKTSLIVAAMVALTITSTRVASGAPVSLAGSKSVRAGQIDSSVNHLLGWRVGVSATAFRSLTFSESAALADALGLGSIEGISSQKVSPQIDKDLDFHLSLAEIATVKARLTELNLKMPA